MDASKGVFRALHPFASAEQVALYESFGGFLQGLLVRQFQVPPEDAELLVCEAFCVYIQMGVPVTNQRAWLISATCSTANAWLQRRGLPQANNAEIAQTAGKLLSHREALALLPKRAREALRLRFDEKMDYPEIAAELGVSTFMAKHYVAKGVARLREVLRGGTRQP